MTNLKEFWINNNELTGTIPPQFGDLENLDTAYLSHNKLTGTIPVQIGQMYELESLKIDWNRIKGTVPDEVCALKQGHDLKTLITDCSRKITKCDCCDNYHCHSGG
jgi:Leucine-rich repeat (LRR) protein